MAKIERREIVQEIIQGLRLDVGREKIPTEVEDKLRAVYIAGSPPKLIRVLSELTINDNDKTITVPAGKQWRVLYAHISYTATADAGSRLIQFQFRDASDNNLYFIQMINTLIASATEVFNLFQFSIPGESVAGFHNIPIPHELYLNEGFDFRVFDSADINDGDDMTIRLVVEETDISQLIE